MSRTEPHLEKIAGVFRGKEAKYNKVIFRILANQGPQGHYDLRRLIGQESQLESVSYSVINRRVKALEGEGYLVRVGSKRSKAGLDIPVFALSFKGSLAALLLFEKREDTQLDKFLNNLSENPVCWLAGFLRKKGIGEGFIWELFIEGVKGALTRGLINLDVAEVSDIILMLNGSLLRRIDELSDQLLAEKELLSNVVKILKSCDGMEVQAEIYGAEMGLQMEPSLPSSSREKIEPIESVYDRLFDEPFNTKKDDIEVARENIRYLCELFEMMRYGGHESFKHHFRMDS